MNKAVWLSVLMLFVTGCSSTIEDIKKNPPYFDSVEVKDLPGKIQSENNVKPEKTSAIITGCREGSFTSKKYENLDEAFVHIDSFFRSL